MDTENTSKNKNLFLEILRFVVVGGGATIIDLICEWAVFTIIGGRINGFWSGAIAVTVGFLVSTIFNYLLSLVWVFKNVKDEKMVKRSSSILVFVILSAIGLGLGIGLQLLGQLISSSNFAIDISQVSFTNVFTQNSGPFWAFCIVFVIKTSVTMVYNYVSRKFLLFKAPKKDEA